MLGAAAASRQLLLVTKGWLEGCGRLRRPECVNPSLRRSEILAIGCTFDDTRLRPWDLSRQIEPNAEEASKESGYPRQGGGFLAVKVVVQTA